MIGLLKYKDNRLSLCGAEGCKSPTRTPGLKAFFSQVYASAPFSGLSGRIWELFCLIATWCTLASGTGLNPGQEVSYRSRNSQALLDSSSMA